MVLKSPTSGTNPDLYQICKLKSLGLRFLSHKTRIVVLPQNEIIHIELLAALAGLVENV